MSLVFWNILPLSVLSKHAELILILALILESTKYIHCLLKKFKILFLAKSQLIVNGLAELSCF